jgi:8-oxo-dGTP diphosphatase
MLHRAAAAPHFPERLWSGRRASFEADSAAPPGEAPRAVIVFARASCGYVLADIAGRGWTVPSGHIEPGEAPEDAAVRETLEEVGAAISAPVRIGRYVLVDPDGSRLEFPTFVAFVQRTGAIPSGSESRRARCFRLEEIPAVYWFWDDLLESVFRYADARLDALAEESARA